MKKYEEMERVLQRIWRRSGKADVRKLPYEEGCPNTVRELGLNLSLHKLHSYTVVYKGPRSGRNDQTFLSPELSSLFRTDLEVKSSSFALLLQVGEGLH